MARGIQGGAGGAIGEMALHFGRIDAVAAVEPLLNPIVAVFAVHVSSLLRGIGPIGSI